MSNIFFRKSLFHPPADFKLDGNQRRTASSESRSSVLSISPISSSPVTRYALRLADFKIVDGLATSSINHLFHVRQQNRALQDGRLIEALRATVWMWPTPTSGSTSALFTVTGEADYEAEAQVSIQPLQINLDQATLAFLRAYHNALTKLTEHCLRDMGGRVSIFQVHSNPSDNSSDTSSNGGFEEQPIFIRWDCQFPPFLPLFSFRRLSLSPPLPIRFNYHGHQLDLTQGTLLGLLALCLQLKNAELVLPQYTYQKGYRGVGSLAEAVTNHWTRTLKSNLTQMLLTSVGPMHEVTSICEFGTRSTFFLLSRGYLGFLLPPIVCGVRDFVRHTVGAFSTPAGLHRGRSRRSRGRHGSARPSADQVVQGLRSGVRALSDNAVWPILELSSQGVRTVQYVFEVGQPLTLQKLKIEIN